MEHARLRAERLPKFVNLFQAPDRVDNDRVGRRNARIVLSQAAERRRHPHSLGLSIESVASCLLRRSIGSGGQRGTNEVTGAQSSSAVPFNDGSRHFRLSDGDRSRDHDHVTHRS